MLYFLILQPSIRSVRPGLDWVGILRITTDAGDIVRWAGKRRRRGFG